MMNVNELSESKYITKADIGNGVNITITGQPVKRNMASEGEKPDWKLIISSAEFEKDFVGNVTNCKIIAAILNDEESDNWAGNKVQLYFDPTVGFGNKITGGIRVREAVVSGNAQSPPATQPVAQQPAPVQEVDDTDVPF